jgi:hypothetical protein
LVSHLPIIGKAIGEKERVELTKGALIALGNKDFATTKKVFDWTLSHLDAEEYEEELIERVKRNGGDVAVKTITQAFKDIFKDYMGKDDLKIEVDPSERASPRYVL